MPTIFCNPTLDARLVTDIVDLWHRVVATGGAVGFVPGAPREEVRVTAERHLEEVRAGRDDLVVAVDGDDLAGFGFLVTDPQPLRRHLGTVMRLQRDPDRPGEGIGGAVLDALEDAARARRLALVTLTVRGGTGYEAYYVARGYRVDARLPQRLRLGDNDFVEEVVLSKDLRAAPSAAGATVRLAVHRVDPGLPLPSYARADDAGLDLRAAEEVTLAPGERASVPTGLAVAVPVGYVGLVHPRSGLAARHGIGLVNAPGTIDAGYRGEIHVLVVNHDLHETVTLDRGERIAQLLVQRVEIAQVVEVAEAAALGATARGAGGFGSTGR